MVAFRLTTLSARDGHLQDPRKKIYRGSSNIKSAHVCALTGSVPRKMAEAWQKLSALIKNRIKVALLFATHLNHSAIDLYQ